MHRAPIDLPVIAVVLVRCRGHRVAHHLGNLERGGDSRTASAIAQIRNCKLFDLRSRLPVAEALSSISFRRSSVSYSHRLWQVYR